MRTIISCTLCLILLASTAMAESIDHRLGLTGRLGFIVPLKDSTINGSTFSLADTGFAGGGGLIYGFNKYLAAEFDVTHVNSLDVEDPYGARIGEANLTDIGIGIQYRILPDKKFVPYLGLGGDFIKGDIEDTRVEWTFGGHVNAGFDYFLNPNIALNIDCRYLLADKADITMSGVKVGSFDPMNITTTAGIRLILPRKWW